MKIPLNALRNNWLKDNLKVLWYNSLRINYEKFDEKCYDQ